MDAIGTRWLRICVAVPMMCAATTGCTPSPVPADLVLLHGKIVTLDDARARARALASRGGRIVAVGEDDDVARYVGPSTRVIDLHGHLAVPGFIESHAHFLGLGQSKLTLDLRGTRTWDEVVEKVASTARSVPAGHFVLGRGWHQEKWSRPPSPSVDGYPTCESIDRAAADHPVFLRHASGHAAIANSAALKLAGIGRDTPDPAGGRIVRDRAGRPTGMLLETATDLVQNVIDAETAGRTRAESEAALRRVIEAATDECLSKGITTFEDAGSNFETVDFLRKMAEAGELRLRLWVMLSEPNERLAGHLAAYRTIGAGNGYLTVRAIKRYMDGALGSRGAWLLEPYSDRPDTTGLPAEPVSRIEETARLALENDFQLCIHAIGDRAVRETLDVYERAFRSHPTRSSPRFRIEHAQIVDPGDVPRFARLGVVAAMQGIHGAADGPWVVARIGERRAAERAYAWRTLLDAGTVIANGTDAPVEDVDPIHCFLASVTRTMADGRSFFPEQRMSREEALRSYTKAAALAAFEDDSKGSLAPGKLADVTVLSRDILTVPDREIPEARVLYTIVGGKVAFER